MMLLSLHRSIYSPTTSSGTEQSRLLLINLLSGLQSYLISIDSTASHTVAIDSLDQLIVEIWMTFFASLEVVEAAEVKVYRATASVNNY